MRQHRDPVHLSVSLHGLAAAVANHLRATCKPLPHRLRAVAATLETPGAAATSAVSGVVTGDVTCHTDRDVFQIFKRYF